MSRPLMENQYFPPDNLHLKLAETRLAIQFEGEKPNVLVHRHHLLYIHTVKEQGRGEEQRKLLLECAGTKLWLSVGEYVLGL